MKKNRKSKKNKNNKIEKGKKNKYKKNKKNTKKRVQRGGVIKDKGNAKVVHTVNITEYNGAVVTYGLVSCTSIFWHWKGKNYLVHTHSLREGDDNNAYNQALGKMKKMEVKNITIYVYFGTAKINEQTFEKYCLDNNIKLIYKHYNKMLFIHIGLSADGKLIETIGEREKEYVKQQEKEKEKQEYKKLKAISFRNKVVKKKSNRNMKWLCSEIHPISYNLICYIHTNDTGQHIEIDKTKPPNIILDPSDLILVNE